MGSGRHEAKDVEMDLIHFSAAIAVCDKHKKTDKAVFLLHEMIRRGITPDVITFILAISACAKGGQRKRALILLRGMIDLGIKPNVVSFNVVISAWGKEIGGREPKISCKK